MFEIITKSNKKIYVFDNLFSFQQRLNFFGFITRRSLFKTTGTDSDNFSNQKNKPGQIFSMYNKEDLERLNFCETEGFKFVDNKFNLNSFENYVRINVSNCVEYCTPHIDNTIFTLIYYVNVEWDISMGGSTLFLSEDLKTVEYCSLFEPGRLILFDGSIPHMVSPPTIYAQQHRYSFVIQYVSNLCTN